MENKIERLRLWLHNEREAVSAISITAADNLSSLAEIIGMATMPLIPALLTGLSLYFSVAVSADNPNGWPTWAAIAIAAVVILGLESLGIASSKTAMRLYHAWRDNLSLAQEFMAVASTVGLYVVLITVINLFSHALPGELRWIGAVAAILAVSMYVVIGFNSDLQRRQDETLAVREAERNLERERRKMEINKERRLSEIELEAAEETNRLKIELKRERELAKLQNKYSGTRLSASEATQKAMELLTKNPEISGSELGRAVGRSERWGRDFINKQGE